MRIVRSIAELRACVGEARASRRTIGLVPTMGAFHDGHAVLMRAARDACDEVVVSLFVNPTQFNETADLAAYPRTEADDVEVAAAAGADVLFAPRVEEIYPDGFATRVSVGGLTETLEGASRGAEHFAGVCTVVAKLLNAVAPDVAFFGQKDAQQVVVLRRMIRDLDMPVRVEVVPTVRAPDGLALSSRNAALSPADRGRALGLSRALRAAELAVAAGELDATRVRAIAEAALGLEPEYLAIVDPDTLAPVETVGGPVLVAIAARVGATRLIDNVVIHRPVESTGDAPPGAGAAPERPPMSTPPRPVEVPATERRPVTPAALAEMRALGEPIVMITAYDHPSAVVAEAAEVDVVLVGDSAANNVLGYADTVPVTVEELIMLSRAVRRGMRTPLMICDMPFGSYEASNQLAIRNAQRFVKQAGCDAVKLEGGGVSAERARAIIRAGVPVMGHVGLTPQTATALGGYRAQGRTAQRAREVLDDALALQRAGCFAIVFEAIPADVSTLIMQYMEVPIIGIGAGAATDGQVLVLHDLLGIHDGFAPKFVKRFAHIKQEMVAGVKDYAAEVRSRRFPASEHVYSIAPEELDRLRAMLGARAQQAASAA